MSKTIYILSLFFLINSLCCSPDRHFLKRKDIRNPYHDRNHESRDASYRWSDNDDHGYRDGERYSKNYIGNSPGYRDGRYRKIIYRQPQSREKSSVYKKYQNKGGGNTAENSRKRDERKNNSATYKIRKGDNLTKIANRFSVTINSLCAVNRIKNPDDIYAGMLIKIPPPLRSTGNGRAVQKPQFVWPIANIKSVKRDGEDGVKSIGIIIKCRNRSSILSSAPGIVEKVGKMRGFGRYIILRHRDRYFTIYSKLKNIYVSEGQQVSGGKVIGRIEDDRLHFQIDNSGKPVDPLRYLPGRS